MEEVWKDENPAILLFFSKFLTPTQQNYTTFDKELYRIVVSLKKTAHLIWSSQNIAMIFYRTLKSKKA
jgi:RNase H-like domain found in reverse transcriptase